MRIPKRIMNLLSGMALWLLIVAPAMAQSPETVLASWDGGDVTVGELRARWALSQFPAPQILEALSSAGDGTSPEQQTELRELASQVREASLDLLCLDKAEREGWDDDFFLRHRAHRLFAASHEPGWIQRLEQSLPVPSEEELAPYLERFSDDADMSEDEILATAQLTWRRDAAAQQRRDLLAQWRDELGYELHEDAQRGRDPLIDIAEERITVDQAAAIAADLRSQNLQAAIDTIVTVEIVANRAASILGEREAADGIRAAEAAEARREWSQWLTADLHATPEAVREQYDYAVSRGAYRTHPQRHILLCRVMSVSPEEELDLDTEAARVHEALAGCATSAEAYSERIHALNDQSPFAIEFLDMDWRETPPTFLGQAFYSMEPGDMSDVVAPTDQIRLIYTVAEVIPARPMTFDESFSMAESVVLANERIDVLGDAEADLLNSVGWHLTFEVPSP